MKKTLSTWLDRLNPAKSKVAAVTTAVGLAAVLPGCLERPLGTLGPRTTNIIVDLVPQNVVSKVDMLFVIDNSMSMADKQAILAEAVPDLVKRFVKPVCLNAANEEAAALDSGDCPQGYGPEFTPIKDIHIGVITSSLGGFGSEHDCISDGIHPYYVQKYDMGHLLGSLSEPATVPDASAARRTNQVNAGGEFLTWLGGNNDALTTLSTNFANQVKGAGEQGCGWEATMEAWVHFLVDPNPFPSIVRKACNGSDTMNSCAGPSDGVDTTIMTQREQFLRMDSLLAVIMLTDENDCSFKLSGQQWLVSDTGASDTSGTFRGSAQCAADPNDTCCQSCGKPLVSGCPAGPTNSNGTVLGMGCESPTYPLASPGFAQDSDDQGNLRCFKQKQRFGADFLLPVERYSNALNELQICPSNENLSVEGCKGDIVANPVFSRDGKTRPKTLVFFGGILGVPWQDLAVDPNAQILKYKKAKADTAEETLNWDLLLGASNGDGVRPLYPTNDGTIDPRMFESVQPRAGVPGPDSGFMADPANGHDWNIMDQSDLQYACIFPKMAVACPSQTEVNDADVADPTKPIANCDCTYYGPGQGDGSEYNSPLCQGQNGQYSATQSFGKAYPGVRELQALEKFALKNPTKNAIVASICPKEADPADKQTKKDWGYRPAVATIVDRLKEQLQEPCLPRPLATKADGGAACIIVEATTDAEGCMLGDANARSALDPAIEPLVYQALQSKELCTGDQCNAYKLCEVPQIRPTDNGYQSCIAGGQDVNGWCYLDQDKIPDGTSAEQQAQIEAALAKCDASAKRKLRFAGKGRAQTASSLTFFACSGSVYDVEM